jgi:hypothetical protein
MMDVAVFCWRAFSEKARLEEESDNSPVKQRVGSLLPDKIERTS